MAKKFFTVFNRYMKISFPVIKFTNQNNNSQINNKALPHNNQNITELSNVYYPVFKGNCLNIGDRLLSLSGIHCPSCGVQMLNPNELSELLKIAEKIKTKDEFIEFINKHIEVISPILLTNVKAFNHISTKYPDIDMFGLLCKAKANANTNLVYKLNKLSEYAGSLTETGDFSAEDIKLLTKCKEDLKQIADNPDKEQLYVKVKDILKSTIPNLEDPGKWKIYARLKQSFARSFSLRASLSNIQDEEFIAYKLIKNLLSDSAAEIKNIDYRLESENDFNKIMMCHKCGSRKNETIAGMLKPRENHPFYRYIYDLSKNFTPNMDYEEISYPLKLNGYMKKLSHGCVDAKYSSGLSNLRNKILQLNHRIDFPLTELDGVPCPGCGKETINHQHKLNIMEQIKFAKDNDELLKIVDDNKRLLRDRYLPIVEEYVDLIKKGDLSSDKIFETLQDSHIKRMGTCFDECIAYAEKLTKSKGLYVEDAGLVNVFITKIKAMKERYNSDKFFDNKKYNDLLFSTIGNMTSYSRHKYIDFLRHKMKNEFASQHLFYPDPQIAQQLDNPLKVILQEIMGKAVATKDHFISRQKQGKEETNNIIVLCKDCNNYKGSSEVFSWAKTRKNAKNNMQKYFNYIAKKVQDGELDMSYEKYLLNLQYNANKFSKGILDIKYSPDDFVV